MKQTIRRRAESIAKLNVLLQEIFGGYAGQSIQTMNVGRLISETDCHILNQHDPVLQDMKTVAEKFGLKIAFHTPNDPPAGCASKPDMRVVNVHVRPDKQGVWRIGDEFAPG